MKALCLLLLSLLCCMPIAFAEAENALLQNQTKELQQADSTELESAKEDPLIDTTKLPVYRNDLTITETIQEATEDSVISRNGYDFSNIKKDWESDTDDYSTSGRDNSKATQSSKLFSLALSFLAETFITSLTLLIALKLIHTKNEWIGSITVGFIVGVIGLVCSLALEMGLLDPIRNLISLAVILFLIRPINRVRSFSVAAGIAIGVRVLTVFGSWLFLIAVSELLKI